MFTRATALEDTLVDTQDFEFELDVELKSAGYLGEKSNRYDEIFNGVKFNGTLHTHTQAWIPYALAIVQRAKRQTPDVVFNITAILNYADGTTPDVLFPDVHFGPVPGTVRSRGDYKTLKIQGACDDFIPTVT
jgi:hypothetical protein